MMMYRHPEGMRVPAWVALTAMSTFAWAGAAILLGEHPATKALAGWAGLIATFGLFVPAAWIAVGPGPRACTTVLPFLSARAADGLCRSAFGLGALIGALMLVLMARSLLASRRPLP